MFNFILPRFIFRVERWKWNKEYRIYVSNMGHFMDEHKKIIPVKINQNGYVTVKTNYGFVKAHRLVMKTWRPTANMEDLIVDHLDHNKRNNSVDNLEWVTDAENKRRAREDYFDDNAKSKEPKKTKKKQAVPSGAEAVRVAEITTALLLGSKRTFTLDDFYPVVNGYAFDDCQTAWWYYQEVVNRASIKQCTIEGLENRFSRLITCIKNDAKFPTHKKVAKYCGNLILSLELKEN